METIAGVETSGQKWIESARRFSGLNCKLFLKFWSELEENKIHWSWSGF